MVALYYNITINITTNCNIHKCSIYSIDNKICMYIVQCTLYIIYNSLICFFCLLDNVHCTLLYVYCTYTVRHTTYVVQVMVYDVHCTLQSVHCTLYINNITIYGSMYYNSPIEFSLAYHHVHRITILSTTITTTTK